MGLRRRYTLLSIFLIAVWGLGYPGTSRADGLEDLAQAAAKIKELSADFVQTKYLKIVTKPLVSRGRLYFAPPDGLRWEYIDPIRSVTLMKKDQVRSFLMSEGRWVEDAGQAIEIRRTVLSEITGWFSGRLKQGANFTPVFHSGAPPRVTLTPKPGLENFVQKVELTLSKVPGVIDVVEIIEGPDTKTRIEYTNVKMNSGLPEGIFDRP